MSEETVEIVRKAIEARNRDLEEWLSFFHPAAVTSDVATAAGMRTGEVRGRDELRRDVEQWHEVFDDFGLDVVELVDLDEWVLAEVRYRGRGGASGAKVALFQVDLYRVREGLITEQRAGYQSREEALKAAGLSEEEAHTDS
jgi:ketosteroid isomerase-like protein